VSAVARRVVNADRWQDTAVRCPTNAAAVKKRLQTTPNVIHIRDVCYFIGFITTAVNTVKYLAHNGKISYIYTTVKLSIIL